MCRLVSSFFPITVCFVPRLLLLPVSPLLLYDFTLFFLFFLHELAHARSSLITGTNQNQTWNADLRRSTYQSSLSTTHRTTASWDRRRRRWRRRQMCWWVTPKHKHTKKEEKRSCFKTFARLMALTCILSQVTVAPSNPSAEGKDSSGKCASKYFNSMYEFISLSVHGLAWWSNDKSIYRREIRWTFPQIWNMEIMETIESLCKVQSTVVLFQLRLTGLSSGHFSFHPHMILSLTCPKKGAIPCPVWQWCINVPDIAGKIYRLSGSLSELTSLLHVYYYCYILSAWCIAAHQAERAVIWHCWRTGPFKSI